MVVVVGVAAGGRVPGEGDPGWVVEVDGLASGAAALDGLVGSAGMAGAAGLTVGDAPTAAAAAVGSDFADAALVNGVWPTVAPTATAPLIKLAVTAVAMVQAFRSSIAATSA